MNTTTSPTSNVIKYALLALYIITGTLSNYGAIDILAPQWIYLGSINLLSCLYVLTNQKEFQLGLTKLSSTLYLLLYVVYLVWNGLSYFYAINPSETLINLPRLLNSSFAVIFVFY